MFFEIFCTFVILFEVLPDWLFDATKSGEIFQTAKRCNDFVYNALLYSLKIIADLRIYEKK